jgi:hypothetical protein
MSEVQEQLPREVESRAQPITDAISAATDRGERPAEAFQPMPENNPAPKEDTFSSDAPGLRLAAAELQAHREAREPPKPRDYVKAAGEHRGERSDITQTVDLERASQDLADQRRAERDAQEVLAEYWRGKEIDKARAAADAADQGLPPPEMKFEAPPLPEATPEPAQPKTKIQQALEDPEIRTAIEQQVAQSEQTRQQYVAALNGAMQVASATAYANFPELVGLNGQQLQGALQAMRQSNPERFNQVAQHIQRVQTIGAHLQQQQQQQQQQQAQQFEHYAKSADNEYEEFAKLRPPGEAKAVKSRVIEFATRELGVDEKTLAELWATNPIIRSPQMQKIFHMATAYHIARESAAKRGVDPNLPKVFTPGVSSDHMTGESVVVANKMRQFAADPTAKNAGAALAARRRAAALNRR